MIPRRLQSVLKKLTNGADSTSAAPVQAKEPSRALAASDASEFARIRQMRRDYLTWVRQPLVMVSQVQRSGGTLLSQLFDGHPECHAHPHELYIGHPDKYTYPDLDLSATPEHWFELLSEEPAREAFYEGYKKFPESATYDKADIFPFLLAPSLQRELFLYAVSQTEIKTQRDVLDCYWTSYFNAWLDYQSLYEPKRFITGFVPRVNIQAANVERFLRDYPDGKLISVIREPKGWYGSSRRQRPHTYPTPEISMPVWVESAEAMLRNKMRHPQQVFLASFDMLLKDTEGVMRAIAAWIGLTWHPTLTEPTFQRQPIKANTAFSTTQYGVIAEPLKRHQDVSDEDAQAIEALTYDLYQRVLQAVDV